MQDRVQIESPIEMHHGTSIGQILASEVRLALSRAKSSGLRKEGIHRVVIPVNLPDPISWLQVQAHGSRLVWEGRNEQEIVAALGIAHVCAGIPQTSVNTLEQQLKRLSPDRAGDARYYGGIRFDIAGPIGAEWSPYGEYRFVLPRFELISREAETDLVCNLVLPRDLEKEDILLSEIERLVFTGSPFSLPITEPIVRHDFPNWEQWERSVEWALGAFGHTSLEKIVLARRVQYLFKYNPDPLTLFQRLRTATPGCFHFYFQPSQNAAFLGASPERLFRREGRILWSEAVAGTRPRGDSDRDDQRLREELLLSEKDQREHEYVRRSIGEALEPLCDLLSIDRHTTDITLMRGRHLYSAVNGHLLEGVSDFDVLTRLHPTPAVGGYPTEQALYAIREREPFDRGWYAGAVGWIGTDRSEFAVAIRSGLVHKNQLMVYSGAGIVPGSTPVGEWEEIEQKIGDFKNVLGLDE